MSVLPLRSWLAAVPALALAGALLVACDTAPGPVPLDPAPPEASALTVVPDTIRVADLPEDDVEGGEATVDITAVVTARDPDGTVDRVLAVIEPSYGATRPVAVQLPRVEGDQFGGTGRFSIAIDQTDVLMLRAFAVDDDSLTSNEVIRSIHVLPDTSNEVN